MLFNSPEYVIFLGGAVALFWLLRNTRSARLWMLFGFSCAFYMAWNPKYIVLMLGSTLLDYYVGKAIVASKTPRGRKGWLAVSLTGNLGLLGTFKYYNFFASATGDVATFFGHSVHLPYLDVLLPVGISFYTFQTMSYTIDVYRGRIEPARSLLDFGVFVTYFPQLVAGPIVRASEFLPQLLGKPTLRREQVSEGIFLIVTGLVKKVAIADFLSVNLVDRVFDNPELYTATEVVVALYCFTMQIYCDFSGYTDVARGSAKLMGLELPENFDRPYQATNPAAYWRRWHMTLSTWLRDYLYYPLGGSKTTPGRAYWNLWLTLFLIGIWHGASWNFVLYGIVQATAMVLHRFFYRMRGGKEAARIPDSFAVTAFKVFCCMQFVVFSRILFRANDFQNAVDITERLMSGTTSLAQVSTSIWVVLGLSFAAHYTPKKWFEDVKAFFMQLPAEVQGASAAGAFAALSLVATSQVVPYIYFQF
jgi:D-alanyl-lipoteichoic acid acyltransferase DltB (MBOAT superfamily)